MVTLTNESDVLAALAAGIRGERIRLGWRQADLAERSGVPLRTLRKFETTGQIGTAALARLLVSLGMTDRFLEGCKPPPPAPKSMDEFLASSVPPRMRQRVRLKSTQS
jgi:transcriptional regulator with XRE-family HTH domain